jgi:hypothetical protein
MTYALPRAARNFGRGVGFCGEGLLMMMMMMMMMMMIMMMMMMMTTTVTLTTTTTMMIMIIIVFLVVLSILGPCMKRGMCDYGLRCIAGVKCGAPMKPQVMVAWEGAVGWCHLCCLLFTCLCRCDM